MGATSHQSPTAVMCHATGHASTRVVRLSVVLDFNYETHNAPAGQISTQSDIDVFTSEQISKQVFETVTR